MGKASRKKQLKRTEANALKKYGDVKLSDALLVLCEPYKFSKITGKQYETLISLSAAAWNLTILPEYDRPNECLKLMQRIPGLKNITERELDQLLTHKLPEDASTGNVMLTILFDMVQRKLEIYPNDNRIVTDLWFENYGQSTKLQVKSVIPNNAGQASEILA